MARGESLDHAPDEEEKTGDAAVAMDGIQSPPLVPASAQQVVDVEAIDVDEDERAAAGGAGAGGDGETASPDPVIPRCVQNVFFVFLLGLISLALAFRCLSPSRPSLSQLCRRT